jgi:protein TonB
VQGLVIIEAVIDAGGNVVETRVLRGNPMLDAAAIEAVSQWRYSPPTLNGSPVSVVMTVTVNFTLD